MIVFENNGFCEKDIEWLAPDEGYETGHAKYWEDHGFRVLHADASWACLKEVAVRKHKERETWIVEIGYCDHFFEFVVEGRLDFLRLWNSPIMGDHTVVDKLNRIELILERSFQAWHGHRAPFDADDHAEWTSCRRCDPDWEWRREQHRAENAAQRQQNKAPRGDKRAQLRAKMQARIDQGMKK